MASSIIYHGLQNNNMRRVLQGTGPNLIRIPTIALNNLTLAVFPKVHAKANWSTGPMEVSEHGLQFLW
ncbi:hypothetical protein Pmani_033331 [Petrolisthes manimaculis]|uniref:Uncharacterized protein n=1 Tax=Petrolisthes manimaculis TaxID=1843537 RepID=A0AAE1NPQ4_9EUCA|nr:hypothetical protein Pmani_033331 [Petrolisthes manimaculis]